MTYIMAKKTGDQQSVEALLKASQKELFLVPDAAYGFNKSIVDILHKI